MRIRKGYTAAYLLILVLGLSSCMEGLPEVEDPAPRYFIPTLAASLQQSTFPQPESNLLSEEGVLLGKTLFYDPLISANGQVSCGTCHSLELAFGDGISLSAEGVSGKPLHRHAPVLFNLAWNEGLFWDGGSRNLESLIFGPLTHPDEMGANLNETIAYLNSSGNYPEMFYRAFGTDSITSAAIGRSLAQFVRSILSQNSKYDQWKSGENALNSLELQGYQLYQEHCKSCHTEGLFTDLGYHNNGLDASFPDPVELEGLYLGRFRISFADSDLGAFKTPSLRNIAFSAPYMHDGRFETLDEVLDHYRSGIQHSHSLSPALRAGITITDAEKEALKAFLHSLSDYTFITNQAYLP